LTGQQNRFGPIGWHDYTFDVLILQFQNFFLMFSFDEKFQLIGETFFSNRIMTGATIQLRALNQSDTATTPISTNSIKKKEI
jgi:hypothetical protein